MVEEKVLQTKIIETYSQEQLRDRLDKFAKDKIIRNIEFDNSTYVTSDGLELIHRAIISYEEFPF